MEVQEREALEEALNSEPDDPSLHFNLGVLLWEQGDESKAAEHLVKSAKLKPDNGVAFRYLGDYYARFSLDSQRAIKCYQRAIALNPDDFHAGEGVCNLLDEASKESLQIAVCKEASNKSPRAFWAFRTLGFLQVHQKRWSEAVQNLQHAIRGYPTCADLWEALGLAYQRLGMFTAATKSYARAVELEDSRIFALIESGNIAVTLGSFRQGIEHFRHALRISPLNVAALHGLASSLLGLARECESSGAFGWAASLLEEASEVAALITPLACNMACIWKLHGDIKLRYARCFPWMENDWSSETDALILRNSILSWKRKCFRATVSACDSYQRALHLAPWEANLYNDVAIALDLRSSLNESHKVDTNSWLLSEKMCFGGLLLEGGNDEFWVALGCLSDNCALKQHAFIRGLQLNISLAVAWSYLGKFYREAGERQLAQLSFDRARSIDPSLALPWAGMSADATVRDLKSEEAYDCCLQAVQILPLAEFQIGLAMLALRSSHLPSSEVFRAIQQALQRTPHYPESHNLHGLICEARCGYQNAIASFRLARLVVASSPGKKVQLLLLDISNNLIRVLCKAGNVSDAVQECEVLKKEGVLDPESLQIYAICLWQLGKNDMALSAVRSIAAGILSMEPRFAASSTSFITRLIYSISGQESAMKSILKMPKKLLQSSEICFVVSAIHALDDSNQPELDLVLSESRQSLLSEEDISSMHCLIALGKLVKNASKHCLGVQHGVHHLRKALHMFPNSHLMRNLIGYLLLSGNECKDVHIAPRCFKKDLYDIKDHILKSTSEIFGAGAVACSRTGFNLDNFAITSCHNKFHSGNDPVRQLQRCLHQEPWNYKARYLLVLNYLQKARLERFPPLVCTTLRRLTDLALSNWVYLKQDTTNEYEKFQLLLCAAEVCLQCKDHINCVMHAKNASTLDLPDSYIFHAHLLLCRAFAVEDNVVSLNKEYTKCLDLKTHCLTGSMCLKLIGSQYDLHTEIYLEDIENPRSSIWLAIDNLVQGLNAVRSKNFLAAEELFAESCVFASDEACLFFCHGIICMELAKQQFESRFVSLSIKSLKKARLIAGRSLPVISLLLAQGEASLGSKEKWEKYIQDEWFSWQQGLCLWLIGNGNAYYLRVKIEPLPDLYRSLLHFQDQRYKSDRPAEIYFQMHLLSRQQNSWKSSSSALDSVQNPSRFILQAIHLNPSCLRYWTVLLKPVQQ